MTDLIPERERAARASQENAAESARVASYCAGGAAAASSAASRSVNPSRVRFLALLEAEILHNGQGALTILIDLPAGEPEIWIPLVADGRSDSSPIGYIRLKHVLARRPGKSTYAVMEVRAEEASSPLPGLSKESFRALMLEAFDLGHSPNSSRRG